MNGKIVYEGLQCTVKARAAFMREMMEHLGKREGWITNEFVEALLREGLFHENGIPGVRECDPETWEDEVFERLFIRLFGEKNQERMRQIPPESRRLLESVLQLDGKTITIHPAGFLTYEIVSNPGSRKKLLEELGENAEKCCQAFYASDYEETCLLEWYPQEDKKAARTVLGLLNLIEEEKDSSWYEVLIRTLITGNRKNYQFIKRRKQKGLKGEDIRQLLPHKKGMIAVLSSMMVLCILAQEEQLEVEKDVYFYALLPKFQVYEREFFRREANLDVTWENQCCYRGFKKKHPELCSVTQIYFQDPASRKDWKMFASVEALMASMHLNLHMFENMKLTEKETEGIIACFPSMNWKKYEQLLFVLTLIKYIKQLEARIEEYEAERNKRTERKRKEIKKEIKKTKSNF